MDADKWDRVYGIIKAKQFQLSAQTPGAWKWVSRNLKRAADKLYDFYHDATLRDIERTIEEFKSGQNTDGARELKGDELEDALDGQLIQVYFLLMGYSFENLLKAILLLEHPEYFKPNAKLKDIRTHDLVNLCGRCKISLTPDENNLLEQLHVYIEWQGKYPIPLDPEKMWPIKQADGSWKTRGEAFHGRETQEAINKLYIKIYDELEQRQVSTT